MNKKAQVQNMETITVVIIIIVMIIFGVVYASNQRTGSLERERERLRDVEAMEIATQVMSMNFLKCSEGEATNDACIDYYKIQALSENIQEDENLLHFHNLLGDSKIKIKILKNLSYTQENENITIFKAPETENKSSIKITTPINVNNPVQRINYFSIMEVTVFRWKKHKWK